MEALQNRLLAEEGVRSAMTAAGVDGIGLYPTDGGRDMLRRLRAGEFDLAFVPSRIWAEQSGGYTVILQTRRERDIVSPRGNLVLQRGLLFVSRRSPLYDEAELSREVVAQYLAQNRIAVVSTQSMAGFVAPMLEMARTYGLTQPRGGLLWCESSAEVTKAVLAGLADVGACEEGAHDETIALAGLEDRKDDLRRVLCRTAPVPTDPVAVRASLAPSRSPLGLELKRVLRNFSLEGGLGPVTLQEARDSAWEESRDLLREFESVVGEISE